MTMRTETRLAGLSAVYNLTGIGIFLLSLGIGALVRLCVPDAVMYAPKAPLSEPGNYLTGAYVIAFVLWLALWFRSPDSPRLTLFGAVWSTIAVVCTSLALWLDRDWSLLPALAICASFSALTFAQWRWMRRD